MSRGCEGMGARREAKGRTKRAGLALLLTLSAAATTVRAATAYEEIVAPIFRSRCSGCHGAQKQKGELALHTWEGAARGGASGSLWVAGKPGESELVRRLKLPASEEEHMPPAEEPQPSAEEIALLVRWIERGASAQAAITDLKLEPALAKAAAQLAAKLPAPKPPVSAAGEAFREVDPAAVERDRVPLAARVAALQRRFPGALSYESRASAALHFTAAGLGRTFGDAELAELAAVGEGVTLLDLSSTAITDAAAPALARFPKLRVARLAFTTVGDEVARVLARLDSLEVVVLSETAASADALVALKKLPRLRKLHASDSLLAALRTAGLPVVDPALAALVPEPAPAKPAAEPPKSEP